MTDPYLALARRFGDALSRDEALARYTVARLGGPADALLIAQTTGDLADAVALAHDSGIPWIILGGGANVLIADAGFRGLVIVNHAKAARIEETTGEVVAESGANLTTLARRCMGAGLAGLEWAVNVPGTIGGAVINNAGAHGGDMAHIVREIEVFSLKDAPQVERWPVERMGYAYRSSALKGVRGQVVVLSGTLRLEPGHDPAALNAQADEFVAHRKRTQPPARAWAACSKTHPATTRAA